MEHSTKLIEAAHRAAYVVYQYPDKKMDDLIELFKLPAIEFNAAFWLAEDLGLITELDPETNLFTFVKAPDDWTFGSSVEHLMEMITYGFQHMAARESELDEEQFGFWTLGYNPAHILIAMKRLIEKKVMATYDLTDPTDLKSTYTFYTLYENAEQMWSKNRFKVQPTGDEVPDTSMALEDDTPEEDKHLNSGDAAESEK